MTTADEIQPALTNEEWEEPHTCDGRDIVDCDICFGQLSRHARAAIALRGQPFGFTWQDVWRLETMAGVFAADSDESMRAAGADFSSIADRIAALLPPAN